MLREGLVEEFTSNSEASPAGNAPPTSARTVLDGTAPGEFAAVGIRETNL